MADVPGAPSAVAWYPTAEQVEESRLMAFMCRHGLQSYRALHRRSCEDAAWFWRAVSEDLGLRWGVPFAQVEDRSQGLPWTRWWVGGQYNYVENCLDRHLPRLANKPAIRHEDEEGHCRVLTYREVHDEVNRLSAGLSRLGIGKGDRVGVFMPLTPECVIATLAVSRLGAAYVPMFSGYGASAVAARLRDADAAALITIDGFSRRGRVVPLKQTADDALRDAPSVRHVIVKQRMDRAATWGSARDHCWDELVATESAEFEAARTLPDDPFLILYTSGTTGRPKGTVHVHGGFPIKAAMDMAYAFDMREDDTLFWVTDLGWMMGPWEIIGAFTLGATIALYDGAIDHPRSDRLWQLLARHGATVCGISPTVIRAQMVHGVEPLRRHDLSRLRVLGSTGEPWNPEAWFFYLREVGGGRCPLINYSGGTEVSGGILWCTPIAPQKPCCFTGPALGMDVDVYDEQGRSVRGSVGELVIRNVSPGMTSGFWRDPGRYLETYWSRWSDVWVHGDFAVVDDDGFWFIKGRSDDTIKVAGKRVGPAEVESALAAHPAVLESAAIGVPDDLKGEAIACFVVLKTGHEPCETHRKELLDLVAHALGRALAPTRLLFVRQLPKTRNGKVMRRVVRATHLGLDAGDLSALENPAALEEIRGAR
ncbi:MAG TPA: AMP-binding protein [Anaeromyxobacteraceae bacterium]|nr:AMP-binding protein [Anaeromyxobacteraceae bacterium]